MSMTGSFPKAEILTDPQRRRRWSVSEKLEIVAETREPGVTVSLVARRHGVSPNQLFTWRRLAEQGALTATRAEEEVVPASGLCHVVERKTRMISLTILFMLQQWPNAMCPWPSLEKLGASLLK